MQPSLFKPDNWQLTPAEAKNQQTQLRHQVQCSDQLKQPIQTVAGIDVGFEQQGTIARAAIAVLQFPQLNLIEQTIARQPTQFPYIPGLLSFREIPVILAAFAQLSRLPDLLLCDAQGLAHPRRFGLACHLGVLTELPSIGVAKTRLCGSYQQPDESKGSWYALLDQDEQIGTVLRTRDRVNPLFISCGHKISLPTAIHYVLMCTTRYRLPETTRWAHFLASGG